MNNVTVYSFADATGLTKYVDSQGDFLFTGTWSSTGTYTATPLMAAQYGAAYYMAIRDNVGDNPQRVPTRSRPTSWSIMSVLYEYSSGTTATAEEAYTLAGSAFALAGSAMNAANSALATLSVGLNGTHTVWCSSGSNGPTTTELTFVNGILTAITPA